MCETNHRAGYLPNLDLTEGQPAMAIGTDSQPMPVSQSPGETIADLEQSTSD